jgi:hypothetical protein
MWPAHFVFRRTGWSPRQDADALATELRAMLTWKSGETTFKSDSRQHTRL